MICHDHWLVGPSWLIIIHPIWLRLKQLTSHQKVEILERNRQSWEAKRRKGAKTPLLIRRDTTTMTWAFIRVLNHGFTLGAIFPIIWKASVVWQVQWSNWSHPVISKSGKLPWQTCAYPIIFIFSEDRLRTSALKSESIKILQHVDQALFLLYNFVPWAEESAEHSKPFWTLKVWPVSGELGATFRPRCWSQMVRSIQAETMRLSGLRGNIFKYVHLTFEHCVHRTADHWCLWDGLEFLRRSFAISGYFSGGSTGEILSCHGPGLQPRSLLTLDQRHAATVQEYFPLWGRPALHGRDSVIWKESLWLLWWSFSG
jgi:hypothetical protein